MTHISTVALFHSSEDGAGRFFFFFFNENVFKMLSERYVAAIKPGACVHSLLSSLAHVCSVASPQPTAAHVSEPLPPAIENDLTLINRHLSQQWTLV